MLFVAVILGLMLAATKRYLMPVEWIGAVAVLLTFGHAQVANRLAERAEIQADGVECYRWARRYWIGKEILWLIYFVMLGAYSALVGVGVFLLYPIWRVLWRAPHPY